MGTTLNRASTWTNNDGLVVGFGPNLPAKEGSVAKTFSEKKAAVHFNYADMASGVNVPVPAGSRVTDVRIRVVEAFAGGTSLTVGDGTDPDGYITAAGQGALAALTEGAVANSDGVYVLPKTYEAADTIDLVPAGTFTAGKGVLEVLYI